MHAAREEKKKKYAAKMNVNLRKAFKNEKFSQSHRQRAYLCVPVWWLASLNTIYIFAALNLSVEIRHYPCLRQDIFYLPRALEILFESENMDGEAAKNHTHNDFICFCFSDYEYEINVFFSLSRLHWRG